MDQIETVSGGTPARLALAAISVSLYFAATDCCQPCIRAQQVEFNRSGIIFPRLLIFLVAPFSRGARLL
jgi:hypothetical protein